MGQALSTGCLKEEPSASWPTPAPVPLPISTPLHGTTVLDTGVLSNAQPCVWHVQGGLRRFPIPVGYRATCSAYGHNATLSVEQPRSPGEYGIRFIIKTDDGSTYSGTTPTAPFAKWALTLHRLEVINGMEAFGFTDPRVQAMLRFVGRSTGQVDAPPAQLTPEAAVGPYLDATAGDRAPSLTTEIGRAASSIKTTPVQEYGVGRSHSLAPSLQTWLPGGTSPKSPPGVEGQLQPADLEERSRRKLQLQRGASGGLPPRPMSRPGSRATVPQAQRGYAPEATLAARPPSRSKRRPASAMGEGRGGKGWTAFTAFGMEMREVVRRENPWASATEIEKMVGRRWASLSASEKQHYIDVAAEVRRSSQGGAPGVGVDSADVGSADVEGTLRRTRSDAATEERQLRPVRRPKLFGPEFDTSDLPGGTGPGALLGRRPSMGAEARVEFSQNELQRMYSEAMAEREAQQLAAASRDRRGTTNLSLFCDECLHHSAP